MSSNEVSIEEARKKLGDYANAAHLVGTTTVITRNGRAIARIAPLENTMVTTTSYGSWNIDHTTTVEDFVAGYLGEHAADYDFAAVVADFRAAINETLPEGVSLNGDELYGPYYDRPEVDLADVVQMIDLGEIAERHDHAV